MEDFLDWLRVTLREPHNAEKWARHLIAAHDWSASNRIEIGGMQTLSGHPEIYTFGEQP